MSKETSTMNIYVIKNVLCDWDSGMSGMAVIAAESIDRAREIFVDNDQFFGDLSDFNDATMKGEYKVIEGANCPEGVVSYVCGGG